jgi:hypothetical protein
MNSFSYNEALVTRCRDLAALWSKESVEKVGKEDAKVFEKMETKEKIKVLHCIREVNLNPIPIDGLSFFRVQLFRTNTSLRWKKPTAWTRLETWSFKPLSS